MPCSQGIHYIANGNHHVLHVHMDVLEDGLRMKLSRRKKKEGIAIHKLRVPHAYGVNSVLLVCR